MPPDRIRWAANNTWGAVKCGARAAPTSGSYRWLLPVAPTGGSYRWLLPVAPTGGSRQSFRHRYTAAVPWLFRWHGAVRRPQ